LDTADMFLNYNCAFTFIEPCPALLRDLIASSANNVEILESGIQDVNVAMFDKLGDGDFLFIDSTHVVCTGSDVCFEVF
jgi:hypothetical protein